jgi:acetylornithine deacetylase/succinyl-diaminopimelate desuccinylase-like protein
MSELNSYINQNKDKFLNELIDLLRIPSVSAQADHNSDTLKAAEFVKEKLLEAGAGHAHIYPTKGHPIVYAEVKVSDAAPTVLVYGHYDVQPSDPDDLWTSPRL